MKPKKLLIIGILVAFLGVFLLPSISSSADNLGSQVQEEVSFFSRVFDSISEFVGKIKTFITGDNKANIEKVDKKNLLPADELLTVEEPVESSETEVAVKNEISESALVVSAEKTETVKEGAVKEETMTKDTVVVEDQPVVSPQPVPVQVKSVSPGAKAPVNIYKNVEPQPQQVTVSNESSVVEVAEVASVSNVTKEIQAQPEPVIQTVAPSAEPVTRAETITSEAPKVETVTSQASTIIATGIVPTTAGTNTYSTRASSTTATATVTHPETRTSSTPTTITTETPAIPETPVVQTREVVVTAPVVTRTETSEEANTRASEADENICEDGNPKVDSFQKSLAGEVVNAKPLEGIYLQLLVREASGFNTVLIDLCSGVVKECAEDSRDTVCNAEIIPLEGEPPPIKFVQSVLYNRTDLRLAFVHQNILYVTKEPSVLFAAITPSNMLREGKIRMSADAYRVDGRSVRSPYIECVECNAGRGSVLIDERGIDVSPLLENLGGLDYAIKAPGRYSTIVLAGPGDDGARKYIYKATVFDPATRKTMPLEKEIYVLFKS